MKIIYVQHPVTPERKKVLRERGFTILDVQHMPADFENPEDPTADAGTLLNGEGEQKNLTVAQIKESLAEKGIEIPDGVTKKADLLALLNGEGEQD